MSLAGLALVLVHAARYGIVHEADEGTSAHLFQIWWFRKFIRIP
jgi:hypothetical protein